MIALFEKKSSNLAYSDTEATKLFLLLNWNIKCLKDFCKAMKIEDSSKNSSYLLSEHFKEIKFELELPEMEATFTIKATEETISSIDYIVVTIAKSCPQNIEIKNDLCCKLSETAETKRLLTLSQQKLKTIIETAVDAIISINQFGIIEEFNNSAEKMFGYNKKEIVGKNVSCLMPEPFQSEHAGYLKRYLKTRKPHIIGTGREVVARKKNGKIFPISLSVSEVVFEGKSYFTGLVRDLSNKKRRNRERETFFYMTHDLFSLSNFEGKLLKYNKHWEDTLGYKDSELKGLEIESLFHKDDIHLDKPAFKGMLGGVNVNGRTIRLRCKNGEYKWFTWNCSTDLEYKTVSSTATDITDQIIMLDKLKKAKEKAEESDKAKSILIAKISHELRTPLNSIIGFSNLMLKKSKSNFSERDTLFIERIRKNGEMLLNLVNGILDFSKTESGFMKANIKPLDLIEEIQSLIDLMQPIFEEKNIDIKLNLPDTCDLIDSDALRIKQILRNFLDNAIKFSQERVIRVSLINYKNSNTPHKITITDSGPGIPKEKMESIFAVFYQLDNGQARRFGGAGLGLAIAKSLSDLLGLEIQIQNEESGGASFSLIFPNSNIGASN